MTKLETTEIQEELRVFGEHYQYDTSYLADLAWAAPEAYAAFAPAQGLSIHRRHLPLDAHFVARVATMRGEDCGPCTQLNLTMAQEAGVDRSLLQTLIDAPEQLPGPLADVWHHAHDVGRGQAPDPARAERLRGRYGDSGLAEMAVVIAGSRLYPTLKKALLKSEACQALSLRP